MIGRQRPSKLLDSEKSPARWYNYLSKGCATLGEVYLRKVGQFSDSLNSRETEQEADSEEGYAPEYVQVCLLGCPIICGQPTKESANSLKQLELVRSQKTVSRTSA